MRDVNNLETITKYNYNRFNNNEEKFSLEIKNRIIVIYSTMA